MSDFLRRCAESIAAADADNSADFEALRLAYLELRVRPEPPSPQLPLLKESDANPHSP